MRDEAIKLLLVIALTGTLLGSAGCGIRETETAEHTAEQEDISQQETEQAPVRAEEKKTTSETASGRKIRVDYSGYAEKKTEAPTFTRLKDTTIPDLQAAADYGEIYPYVGNLLYSKSKDGYSYISGYSYGMADAKGRLIADPTYSDVNLVTLTGPDDEKVSYWLLERTDKVEGASYGEDEDWYEGDTSYALASLDGSVVTPCSFHYAGWLEGALVLAESGDAKDYSIYRSDGSVWHRSNLQLKGDILPGDICECADGCLVVCLNEKYYILDADGKQILGPYDYACDCGEGRVTVTIGEKRGIVDYTGSYLVPMADYDWLSSYENGYCVFQRQGEKSFYAADESGSIVFSAECDDLMVTDKAFVCYDWEQETSVIYDHAGNKLAEVKDEEQLLPDGEVYWMRQGGNTVFCNAVSGESCSVAGSWALQNIILWDSLEFETGSSYLMLYSEDYESTQQMSLYDASTLKVLLKNLNAVYYYSDASDGQNYLIAMPDAYRYQIYDCNLQPQGKELKGKIRIFAGHVLATDDTASTLWDMQGNIIFRYSLLQAYDD